MISIPHEAAGHGSSALRLNQLLCHACVERSKTEGIKHGGVTAGYANGLPNSFCHDGTAVRVNRASRFPLPHCSPSWQAVHLDSHTCSSPACTSGIFNHAVRGKHFTLWLHLLTSSRARLGHYDGGIGLPPRADVETDKSLPRVQSSPPALPHVRAMSPLHKVA
eukprot:356543-Chlamydomonas_euryale.AAC.10